MVGEFSRLRLYSLAALVVLPFSSVCLSYAWAIACGGWPYRFSMRPSSLVVSACFCGSFRMRRSCVFLLSSCSARGRRLLSLLLGFASVPLPAAPAVFRSVSCRRLPLGGYATFLSPDACPAPAVELCLWGLRCLYCGACFQPCAVLLRRLLFCAASPAAGSPSGGLPFSGNVRLPYCCAGAVGWAAALPLWSQCFSYTSWLADVRGVLHPVTRCSHCGCDCSLYGSVVVPYGSPSH